MAQDDQEELARLESWMSDSYNQTRPHVDESTAFVEISRIPKKITPRGMTSMVVAGSKIVPKQTEICLIEGTMENVALVEFKSSIEAHQAVAKLRNNHFGQKWNMKFITDPKFANPEKEALEMWLR